MERVSRTRPSASERVAVAQPPLLLSAPVDELCSSSTDYPPTVFLLLVWDTRTRSRNNRVLSFRPNSASAPCAPLPENGNLISDRGRNLPAFFCRFFVSIHCCWKFRIRVLGPRFRDSQYQRVWHNWLVVRWNCCATQLRVHDVCVFLLLFCYIWTVDAIALYSVASR